MRFFPKNFILCLICLQMSSLTFSESNWHPVGAINVGAIFTDNVGNSVNFPIQNPDTDEFYSYQANHPTETKPLGGIFLGVEHPLWQNYLIQFGVEFNQAGAFEASGSLVQGADEESANTYHYSYSLISQQWLAIGKFLTTIHQYFHPYFLLGLGESFNKAYHYSVNVPTDLTNTRLFGNENTTSFSYALGVGIDANVNAHLRFGLGYRFTDFGKVALGDSHIAGIPVSGTISQSHFYANELLAQFTYIV
ncbi:MAG TPA: outer membrane beta-barrel protein [Gammaproteobacteria bacterium]|jgi:opacity protein-like surface antigen|nr:outer membrane beta-barrel protein [Gammaproteobacteria bacterium]